MVNGNIYNVPICMSLTDCGFKHTDNRVSFTESITHRVARVYVLWPPNPCTQSMGLPVYQDHAQYMMYKHKRTGLVRY